VIEAALERCRLALTRDDHAEARRNEEIAALDAVLRERGV
jgi:hypothetical protein